MSHLGLVATVVVISLTCNTFAITIKVESDNLSCIPYKWKDDVSQCLTFIRKALEDESAFWFGKDFQASGCSYDKYNNYSSFFTDRDPNCANERPKPTDKYLTLGSRLFSNNWFTSQQFMNQLQGFFEVQFTSPAETYNGCNSSGELLSSTIFDVYPEMPAIPAIMVKYPPVFNPYGCSLTQLCTIIFYDAGHGFVHNVWTNWPKQNNLSNFVNPSHGTLDANPYVFLAFRQKREFDYRLNAEGAWTFNISKFIAQFDLEGPIAMNWMEITTDISAQEGLIAFNVANNCPLLLQKALFQDRNFVGVDLGSKNVEELNAWLYVKYDTDLMSYSGCCGKREIKKSTVWLDPIQNGVVQADNVRTKPQISIIPRLFYFPSSKDMQGQTFILFLVQSEAFITDSKISNLTDVGVFVHWCRINIANGNTSTGQDIRPYLEPFPMSSRSPNRFYYLLYKQEGNLANSFDDYFDNSTCVGSNFYGRCGFALNQFVNDNQLRLWGLSRFRLQENALEYPYVQYLRAKYLLTSEKDCAGVKC